MTGQDGFGSNLGHWQADITRLATNGQIDVVVLGEAVERSVGRPNIW